MAQYNHISASFFRRKLLAWHSGIHRSMPWKQSHDAYSIWLSEIILQQTTVAQGTPYYEAFIKAYPTVHDMASASLDEILRLWQGLGYYARARNMYATAQFIAQHYKGIFPDTYNDIASLKGVGPYTAAAIASFAYNSPYAVVDGNVIRVLTRLFGITGIVTDSNIKKDITTLAAHLLDVNNPGGYNQAIMDFGALQCTPRNPACTACPFVKQCYAYRNEMVNKLPLKKAKPQKQVRYLHFILFTNGKNILMQKRTENDVWKQLHTFPLIEYHKGLSIKTIQKPIHHIFNSVPLISDPELIYTSRQQLSHQTINGLFFKVSLKKSVFDSLVHKTIFKINIQDIRQLAMPKIMLAFLDKYYL